MQIYKRNLFIKQPFWTNKYIENNLQHLIPQKMDLSNTLRPCGHPVITSQFLHRHKDLANDLHDTVVIVTFGYCCSSMGGCNLKFEEKEKSFEKDHQDIKSKFQQLNVRKCEVTSRVIMREYNIQQKMQRLCVCLCVCVCVLQTAGASSLSSQRKVFGFPSNSVHSS